jgi:hypothetical protein
MTIEQIQAEVRRIVREQFAQGEPSGIRSALSALFKSAKLDKELQAEMKRLAKAAEREIQDQFVNDRTDNTALDTLLKEASLLGGSVPPKVMDIVARGLRSGWSSAEIDEQLARVLRTASHRVRTLRETARAVLTTQAVLTNAEKNGVQYVRYGGTANAQREFCRQHVGKIYSIAEAKTLVNGFGQNAYLFRGGWNCRHRWEVVVGNDGRREFSKRLQAEDAGLEWSKKDKEDDAKKHKVKFRPNIESDEEYLQEAKDVVRNSKEVYVQDYKGQEQFVYIGSRGYAVVDLQKQIRGYYFHEPSGLNKMISSRLEKKHWRTIQ